MRTPPPHMKQQVPYLDRQALHQPLKVRVDGGRIDQVEQILVFALACGGPREQ